MSEETASIKICYVCSTGIQTLLVNVQCGRNSEKIHHSHLECYLKGRSATFQSNQCPFSCERTQRPLKTKSFEKTKEVKSRLNHSNSY